MAPPGRQTDAGTRRRGPAGGTAADRREDTGTW